MQTRKAPKSKRVAYQFSMDYGTERDAHICGWLGLRLEGNLVIIIFELLFIFYSDSLITFQCLFSDDELEVSTHDCCPVRLNSLAFLLIVSFSWFILSTVYNKDNVCADQITEDRLWKHIYDQLGGHPGNTSAATCTRRIYEKSALLCVFDLSMRSLLSVCQFAVAESHYQLTSEFSVKLGIL